MEIMSEYSIAEKIKQTHEGKLHGAFMVGTSNMGLEEQESLKNVVTVVGLIQEIHWVNKILDDLGRSSKVETDIFHDLIDLLLNPKSEFTDIQRERYFRTMLKLENFRKTTQGISDKNYSLTRDVEFRVLGITKEAVNCINQARRFDSLDDTYFNFSNLFIEGGYEYEKFISSFNTFYNSLLEKCKSEKEVTN